MRIAQGRRVPRGAEHSEHSEPIEPVELGPPPPGFAAARAVADAVLYEGYLLYPYRRSSGKNRVRWQFGVLAPRPWVEANCLPTATVAGSSDAWRQRTECLVEAPPSAVIHIRLRFLQLQRRSVQQRSVQQRDERAQSAEAPFVEVDAASSGGERYLTFDEAVEREIDIAVELSEVIAGPCQRQVFFPAAESVEPVEGDIRIVRTQQPVSAVVSLSAQAAETPFPAWLLRVENREHRDGPGHAGLPPGGAEPRDARHAFPARRAGREVPVRA